MRINILNKTGMLSDEDRKQRLEHGCSKLSFKTCIDLTKPNEVTMYGGGYGGPNEISLNDYSNDVASFFTWWTINVLEDLNGFSGFGNVKFRLSGFKVV